MVMQHPPSQNPAAATIPVERPFTKGKCSLESQRGWSGSHPAERASQLHAESHLGWFSIVPWTLSRAWYTGTVPPALGGVDDGGISSKVPHP